MRTFEILLLVANLPLLVLGVWSRPPPSWTWPMQVLAVLILAVHLSAEGQRWQLYPAYVATAGLLIMCIWPRSGWQGPWACVVSLGGLVSAAALGTILPVFAFPRPTGPFPIGTVIRHWEDPGREEAHAEVPGSRRELVVQVWYPAEREGPRQPYLSRSEVPFKKSHLALVETHATPGVPLARAAPRFPVLIFCPSWTGRRFQNTFLVEQLASRGYVVVGIDHPFGSELTVFPDGRIARTVLGEFLDPSSDEAFEASLRRANAELKVRADDVRFVLDELERLDRGDPAGLLTDRLDTTRVGVFGHSFGGAVAAEVCGSDRRFVAGIDLDGCLFGEATVSGVAKPFLFMSDDTPIPDEADLERSEGPDRRYLSFLARDAGHIRRSLEAHGGYWARVLGASHMNFCDSPLYSPARRLTGAGPIGAPRAMKIINDYVVAFFEEAFGGADGPLLAGPSPRHPEVEFEARRRPEARADAPPGPDRSSLPAPEPAIARGVRAR